MQQDMPKEGLHPLSQQPIISPSYSHPSIDPICPCHGSSHRSKLGAKATVLPTGRHPAVQSGAHIDFSMAGKSRQTKVFHYLQRSQELSLTWPCHVPSPWSSVTNVPVLHLPPVRSATWGSISKMLWGTARIFSVQDHAFLAPL